MTEKEINNYIDKNFDENHNGKHFLLMLFKTEIDLGISSNPNRWECIRTIYFTNGMQALEAYANIPNPASQLIDAKTKEGLKLSALETIQDMKDEKWLNENLYPYL